MAPGDVDVRRDGDHLVVRLAGEVDLAVRQAADPVWEALAGTPADVPVDVDLGGVTFMDSSGLSVLVRLVRDAHAQGRPIRLAAASETVEDLLATTGVDTWMRGQGVRRTAG